MMMNTKKLIIKQILVIIVATICNIKIQSNALNPEEYLLKKVNPVDIFKNHKNQYNK